MSTAFHYTDYRAGRRSSHPTVSFELYPPRNPKRSSSIWAGVERLIAQAPHYVSVTYGAAGSTVDTRDRSVQVLMHVHDKHPELPAVAHLTCYGTSQGELVLIVRLLLRAGVRDFLAIRGDPPADGSEKLADNGLTRAVQLVRLIRAVAADELPDGVGTGPNGSGPSTAKNPRDYVSVAVAAYPASRGMERQNDIDALLDKQAAGADYAITQVFYDPDDYSTLVKDYTAQGGTLPIVPGILPLHDLKRLRAMERLPGIPPPPRLLRVFEGNPPGPARVRASLQATTHLIADCLKAGAPGVHLYTFNRPRPTLDILEYLKAAGFLTPAEETYRQLDPGAYHKLDLDTELAALSMHHMPPGV